MCGNSSYEKGIDENNLVNREEKRMLPIPIVLITIIDYVICHGRLVNPPPRNSLWRYGYETAANYDDMQLYCGGFARQWEKNKGRCGLCGDAFDDKRDHEYGGKFASGIIGKTYRENSIIKIEVMITANHGGYFLFNICPLTGDMKEATKSCLKKHPLYLYPPYAHEIIPSQWKHNVEISNGRFNQQPLMPLRERKKNRSTKLFKIKLPPTKKLSKRYWLPSQNTTTFTVYAKLPKGVTCERCVLRWIYDCGNRWGTSKTTGKSCLGCADEQEQFVNCADIRIRERNGEMDGNKEKTKSMKENGDASGGNSIHQLLMMSDRTMCVVEGILIYLMRHLGLLTTLILWRNNNNI
ncbi:hypothetical protein SNEBB_006050 [Seison nebaliae]|nr:hypothetical protein SNEBB_006050 [Seison nebaliae]